MNNNSSLTPDSQTKSPEECHACPVDCPNRHSGKSRTVVGGGYIFALIVALLLGIQSLDASYKRVNGEENVTFATKSPPSAILIVGLTLVGLGLGIEIDKSILSASSKGFVKSIANHYVSENE
jgi:hypothetical protein